MDKHTRQQRSFNMSQIKSKNTKPELFLVGELQKLALTFVQHYPIYGKPDIAFPDKKVAVFINGEFWHGRWFKEEKNTYKEFWVEKIGGNIKRDKKNYRLLKNDGWKVVKIWDKDLKKRPHREISKILRAIDIRK